MKNLISKSTVKIFIAIILCAIISVAISNFAPHMSNDMALGQLENDDYAWSAMQTWNNFVEATNYIQLGIWLACAGSVGVDVIKYFKSRKENENEAH